jgi:predicted P-loop ATPase
MAINFEGLAAHLLANSVQILQSWFPAGKLAGQEFQIGNLAGEPGKSLSINTRTGIWKDFAGDDAGSDLTSLYAAIHNLTQAEAARALGPQFCSNGDAGPPLIRRPEPPEMPALERPPADAADPPAHYKHGEHAPLYRYRDAAGLIYCTARYETAEGKAFAWYRWRDGDWECKAPTGPRALYGLWDLQERPAALVLVVEGEKCRDAAAEAMRGMVVLCWPGGAKAVDKADWSVLAGRDVALWPDADEAGRLAMADLVKILLPIVSRLRAINVHGQPEGWDIADAVADGWDFKAIADFIKPRLTLVEHPVEPQRDASKLQVGRPHSGPAPIEAERVDDEQPAKRKPVSLVRAELGLLKNSGGIPFATMSNAALVIKGHPAYAGRIWLDTFRGRLMFSAEGGARPWSDADDLALTDWMQREIQFEKMGLQIVRQAVQLVGSQNRRNSVQEYLAGLQWDREPRLATWLADFLGTPNTPYEQALGPNWLISMVARAFRPGCQSDHMPVLEGHTGRGKSTALHILGGQWYQALSQSFGGQEFIEAIQGQWLVEIPDMAGFTRSDHTRIISAITTRSDRYRQSYGVHSEDHPRVTIFAATSETDDYLQDRRGVRRYWPVRCSELNLDALSDARDQLFAEAVAAFRAGASWHVMPESETRAEQELRQQNDIWLSRIAEYASTRNEIIVADVAEYCLEIDKATVSDRDQKRIGNCLRALGYVNKTEWYRGAPVRVYRLPPP